MKNIQDLISHGFVLMPLNERLPIIRHWHRLTDTPKNLNMFHSHNVGILTGKISGITILDIGSKSIGMKLWNNLSSCYPTVITPIAKTSSGKLHIYFKYNSKVHSSNNFKLRGSSIDWDLLNNDRYVIAPGSTVKVNGKSKDYKWMVSPHDASIVSMPQWLEEYLSMLSAS